MLRSFIAPAIAGLLMLPASAAAGQTAPQPQEPQPQQEQQRDQQRERDQQRQDQQRVTDQRRDGDMVIRADRLTGQVVRARGDERVGRIDDLAVNVNDNRIEYVIVSRGGLFGIGADQVAVRWNQIQPDQQERVVRFQGTEAELQQARRVDTRAEWPMDIGREGERPVGTAGEQPRTEPRTGEPPRPGEQPRTEPRAGEQPRPGEQPRTEPRTGEQPRTGRNIVSANRLIGMDLHNQQGERLGQIDDITIKRDGSLGYVVIAHGGFLGMGHNYVAVPWERLQVNAQQERVVLNVTRQQLEQAPRFEHRDGRWPASVDWPFGTGL
jgi:sporulation protein YlmC with PRC-barrel domain